MNKWMVLLLAGTGCLLPAVATAAEDVASLKKRLDAQDKKVAQLKEQLDNMQAQQKEQAEPAKATAPSDKKAGDKTSTLPDSLKWAEIINWSGDLRFRTQWLQGRNGADDRYRQMIRNRLKLSAKVTDEWDLGLRLRTKLGDPVSGNETLTDSMSNKAIGLDQAYANWRPKLFSGLSALAGKFDVPFCKAGDSELIWDKDLSMEGMAAAYDLKVSRQTKINMVAGWFWVQERQAAHDTMLYGLQASVQQVIGKLGSIVAGAGYYNYGSIKGYPDLSTPWSGTRNFFGNSNSNGLFTNDYNLLEGFAEFTSEVKGWPVAAFGNYVINRGANGGNGEDQGWLVGAKFNKASTPGSWEVNCDYRDIDNDAVMGQFCDSDFGGGGAGVKGYKANFTYQIAKNVQGAVSCYDNEVTWKTPNVGYHRIQVDLLLKFK